MERKACFNQPSNAGEVNTCASTKYDSPESLERLKNRGLSKKRSLALREFALGIEGLERFVKKKPLRRVHESVFGVLALESEEMDPRL